MKKVILTFLPMIIVCSSLSVRAQKQSDFQLIKTFHIASNGSYDYLAAGPGNNRLYVSHGTQVNILDETSGDSIGVIPDIPGVHGVAFAAPLGKGYTSNGQLHNVTVFDLHTNKVLRQISTGGNPDFIMYDAFSKKIIVCAGQSKGLCVIDPFCDSIVAVIPLSGSPEAAVSNGAGKIYVNIKNRDQIDVVDIAQSIVENHWSLGPGKNPTGLAIDIKTNRLFSGCFNKWLIVLDAISGKTIDSLLIGEACDGVVFDANQNYIFTANGDSTFTVIKEENAGYFKVLFNIFTQRDANTIAIDQQSNILFLPARNFETAPISDMNGRKGKPKLLNGIQVMVYQYGH